MKLTHEELVLAMRACADGKCDVTCPYYNVEHDCSEQLLRDAADAIEEG